MPFLERSARAVLATLGACSVLCINAMSAFGQGTPSPFGKADNERLLATYASFSYKDCTSESTCGPSFFAKAGVRRVEVPIPGQPRTGVATYNPRDFLNNLDPKWIVGWEQLRGGDTLSRSQEVCQALAVAAVRRTWEAMCHQRYQENAERVQERIVEARKALDRAAMEPDYYAQISALVAMKKNYQSQRFADGQLHPVDENGAQIQLPRHGYHPRVDAYRFFLEKAVLDIFTAKGIGYLYTYLNFSPTRDELDAMIPIEDATLARDRFCYHAINGRLDGVPELPVSNIDESTQIVRPVFSSERIKQIKDAEQAARHMVWNSFGKVQAEDGTGRRKDDVLPTGVFRSAVTVSKIARREGAIVVSDRRRTVDESHDRSRCRRASNGDVFCANVTLVNDVHTEVTFEEVPKRVTDALAPGDTISFIAKEVSSKQRTLSESPRRLHHLLEQTLSVHHLIEHCKQGSQTCQRYW